MKKMFLAAFFGMSAMSVAQVSFAGKANLLVQTGSPTWEGIGHSVEETYKEKGKNSIGYNVGLSAKVNLPGIFFLMPEFYYTEFHSKHTDAPSGEILKAKSGRLDVPILAGIDVFDEYFSVFAGPVVSYNLAKGNGMFTYANKYFSEEGKKNFGVGYQFGVQVQMSKLILNARYEGAFSKDQRRYWENVADAGRLVKFDNRPALFSVGVGYKF